MLAHRIAAAVKRLYGIPLGEAVRVPVELFKALAGRLSARPEPHPQPPQPPSRHHRRPRPTTPTASPSKRPAPWPAATCPTATARRHRRPARNSSKPQA